MLNKIGRFFAYAAAILFGLWWLRRDAKSDAADAVRAEQDKETLNRVEQANEVEQDIDRLSPDERRERLRNRAE